MGLLFTLYLKLFPTSGCFQRAQEGQKRKGRLWKLFWAIDYENRAVIYSPAKITCAESEKEHSCIMPATFAGSQLQIKKKKTSNFSLSEFGKPLL